MRSGEHPEERLRAALRARVDEIDASPDALPRIRMRTAERRRNGWAMIGAAAAVATAIAVAVAVVADRGTPPVPGASSTAGPSGPSGPSGAAPVEPPPGSPAPSVREGQPITVALPVYFARNGRLYREFQKTQLAADSDRGRILAAVGASLRGETIDPDYRTLWPAGVSVHSVAVNGRTVTVDLGDVGTAPRDGSPQLAVQQLLYTVAAATTYTSVKKADGVRILVDGAPVAKLWGAADTGGTLHQAPQADVLAPVWVIDPQQDEQVGRTFTVYLAGIVAEGTVNLRIRGAGGELEHEGVVRLSAGAPALGEAKVTVTLPPGRYTVEAFFLSAKDGSVQGVDDHEFTVG